MSIRSYVFASIAAIGLAMPATEAFAASSRTASIAPLGFQLFCLKNPKECKASKKASVTYSAGLMKELKKVNLLVNRKIKPKRDKVGQDRWSLGKQYGDCEDYVLAKRQALIRAGLPSGALRIATARTRRGEGHAVLIVKTSRGDLVLDNLSNSIKSKASSGLRFISISGSNPTKWASNS